MLATALLFGVVPSAPAFGESLPPLSTLQLSQTSQWTDSQGSYHVVGEVTNGDPSQTARFIKVQCTIHDLTKLGNPAITDSSFTEADMLKPATATHPAEKSPFHVILPAAPSSHDAAACTVSGFATNAIPNHDFAITISSVTPDADGVQQVKGTITNKRNTTVNHVKLMLTYYDPNSGNPVDETSHYLATDANSSLGPSATANFLFERLPPPDEPAWSYSSASLIASLAEAPAPTTVLSPSPFDFGGQIQLTASAPQTFTVSNIGDGDLHVASAGLSNTTDFGITANRCLAAPVLAGQSCRIDIVFHPMSVAPTGTTLTVVDDALGLGHTVNITGTGLSRSGASLSTSSIDFGEQPVTTASLPQTVTLTSLGPDPLSNITVAASANYVLALDACTGQTLVMGSTCAVAVSFAPTTTGTIPGQLSFTDNGRYSPQTVGLTGKGTVLALTINPSVVDFGPVVLGTTTAATPVTMSNVGSATAQLGPVSLGGPNAGDFSIVTDQCSGVSLGSTSSCTVTVNFRPTVAGSRAGVLNFAVNGRSVPLTVLLIGSGLYPTPPPLNGGAYHPLDPSRILDTRYGPTPVGLGLGAVGRGQTIDVQITGRGNVPDTGVAAVVVNVTVTNTDGYGYLTVYPTPAVPGAPPLASNLNWTPGTTVPNLVEVAVGAYGRISIFNGAGSSANVIVDVEGYVSVPSASPGRDGRFMPTVPARILDTRYGPAPTNAGLVPVPGGNTINVKVLGAGGVPSSGVEAVVVNVTVTNATTPSYLTVFPAGSMVPLASNLNFNAGQTVPNRVIVKVGANGSIAIFNGFGAADVVVDVNGWFSDDTNWQITGSGFKGTAPTRILDTRTGTADLGSPIGAMGPGTTMSLPVAGRGGVPGMGAHIPPTAVVLNVTVTNPSAGGYLTIWPGLIATPPLASDLNFTAGETVPNLVVVKLGPDGTIQIFNGGSGSTDVVADVVGWYS